MVVFAFVRFDSRSMVSIHCHRVQFTVDGLEAPLLSLIHRCWAQFALVGPYSLLLGSTLRGWVRWMLLESFQNPVAGRLALLVGFKGISWGATNEEREKTNHEYRGSFLYAQTGPFNLPLFSFFPASLFPASTTHPSIVNENQPTSLRRGEGAW